MEKGVEVAGEIVFFNRAVFLEVIFIEEVVVAEVTESGGVDKFVDGGFCGGVGGSVHCWWPLFWFVATSYIVVEM